VIAPRAREQVRDEITVTVPGRVYEAAIEGSGVPAEERWPTPDFRVVGRGYQAQYRVTHQQALLIATHLEDLAEGLGAGSADEDAQRDSRAMAAAAPRVRAQLAARVGL
jgi:hypothetical protein